MDGKFCKPQIEYDAEFSIISNMRSEKRLANPP